MFGVCLCLGLLYACPLLEIHDNPPPEIHISLQKLMIHPPKFFSGYIFGVPPEWCTVTEILK